MLTELHSYTGGSELMFPGEPKKRGVDTPPEITDNSLIYAMHRMGWKRIATPHGFRSTGATVLYESNRFSGDAIELQLAHVDKNQVRAAYNRGDRLEERRRMMQWLADYYDSTKPGTNIVPLGKTLSR